MTDAAAMEQRAGQALRAGNTTEMLGLGRALVAAEPERLSGWLYQALALILDGRADLVYRSLLPHRRARLGCDGILFLKDVFLILAARKAHDVILAAALQAPPSELFSIIPTYFAACVLLERRCFDDGFTLLAAFRNRCLQNLAALPTADAGGFMVLFRHALLVNDPGYLETAYFHDNLALNQGHLDQLQWAIADKTPDQRPVLMVSCDQHYAELFLPRFLASVDSLCSDRLVHLHILDPASEPPVPVPLIHNRLAISWERSGALKCGAWYASARFVRMAAFLEHYQRPIILFDADVALCHPVETVEQAFAECDFGCFRMDRLDPASVYQASITAFRPTPAGLELARLLGDLILSKMSLQRPLLWLIDQASLYSAITILADRAGRLRVADFRKRLGLEITEYVTWCPSTEDKLKLMKQASGVIDPT